MANTIVELKCRSHQESSLTFFCANKRQADDGRCRPRMGAVWVDDYYTAVYRHMPGYRKPQHFMEIPLWVSVISGMAGDRYAQRLHIVSDVAASVEQLAETPGTLMFSAIESNAPQTHQIVQAIPHKRIVMGGHVDPATFAHYPNVTFLNSPMGLPSLLPGIDTSAAPDNHLFAGIETIRRLTLSTPHRGKYDVDSA